MDQSTLGGDVSAVAQEILGYLNFSSGAPDPRFLKNLSELFGLIEASRPAATPTWQAVGGLLRAELQAVRGTRDAFRQVDQVEAILGLVFDAAVPAYREFHRDLLFHHADQSLFQPFFVGRVCEAVLQQGGPWNQPDRIIPAALHQLNDYLGHRPVAVLRTEQKIQPYDHEWVRPIPLWIRGAGVAAGPYRELIETALAILEATDPSLLFEAMFSIEQLDELALDPRAYDFDHPVNKRPNYLFGQWDMNRLDNSGRSRRFVLQPITLDAMLDRLDHHGKLPRKQVLFEEAAVLAGTMLMGSGVGGSRPDAHDSTVTLATLVQRIAAYRDNFYDQLLRALKGTHGERLRTEAVALRQPLGGARQHFNHYLARQRARQLQHVHLAQLFAAMGYTQAASRQAQIVAVAAARMSCEIRCHWTTAQLLVDRGKLAEAAAQLKPIEDLLRRAIECGAMVDPWNILGFGAQYSLFPAMENSVHDHRVDDLLNLVAGIFGLYVEIYKAAAAVGDAALQATLSRNLAALVGWWDKFATTEVGSVDGISGQETLESAEQVAIALRAWHQAGAAAGDVGFWRQHVEQFRSPKAFALVIETLLDHRDRVAAMALLVQWLNQADEIPLAEDDYSFHDLALVWMEELWGNAAAKGKADADAAGQAASAERWPLARKFLDYLEANAEEYGRVPQFEMADAQPGAPAEDADEDEHEWDDEDNLFGAAYEGVTYRDTTDDGVEGEMFDVGPSATDFELVNEAERIVDRLGFLTTLAQLWKLTATASLSEEAADRDETLSTWLAQALDQHRQLLQLLATVQGYRIPPPRGTHEALVEYDRRRGVKEMLLEEIIEACVEMADAARMVHAAMRRPPPVEGLQPWETLAGEVLGAALRGDAQAVRAALPKLLRALGKHPLLYVALGRGGKPHRIVAARGFQCLFRRLLNCLPRLGLLPETVRLLATAQKMELEHPVGPGAITEFDRVFEIACRAIIGCLVESSAKWRGRSPAAGRRADAELIDYIEQLIEVLLHCWLVHSRGVRLSVLETVDQSQHWNMLKRFIERYGNDLFTQYFMNMGNLRGILHQGVDAYLESLQEDAEESEQFRLLAELDSAIPRDDAAHWLGVAIEAVVENYGEYIDYNSITTQSDRGEMLYTLLDFLRLRARYDRLAWNLRPVLLAHEVLVRRGFDEAAGIWRGAVAQRTALIADEHLKEYAGLGKKYSMRLPSIADHLAERFVRPLEIDELRALVRPAIDQLRQGREPTAFKQLEKHLAPFVKEASGAGFETPGWLEALEQEVEQIQWRETEADQESSDLDVPLPQVRLSRREVERQIKQMLDEMGEW